MGKIGSRPGFPIWTDCRPRDGVHRAARPVGKLAHDRAGSRKGTRRRAFYGLDVHKRAIQACAMDEAGHVQREFQSETTPGAIDRFAAKLGPADAVVLEATFHTWAIWARLVGRAGRVVVANPLAVKAIAHARIKTDTIDARTRSMKRSALPEGTR